MNEFEWWGPWDPQDPKNPGGKNLIKAWRPIPPGLDNSLHPQAGGPRCAENIKTPRLVTWVNIG